ESYEDLKQYIQTDIGGLHDILIKLIGGGEYDLKKESFSNDIVITDKLKGILLTLTQLGYLSYNTRENSVVIPNHEIRSEFVDTILEMEGTPLDELMKDSAELLEATIDRDEMKVCELIKKIHLGYSSLRSYKDEGTLTAIVRYAYIFALGKYKAIPEAEAGDGYSDLVLDSLAGGEYVPLIIELEHNRSAEAAIKQIKDTNYVDYFVEKGHKGTVLYVGINYKTRKGLPRSRGGFTCKIEAEEI
ncbi:MAG: hypothetical protein LUD72_06095, partial [Bacteroidales bacterium]|nr:hypothetical protein [Bacteroidales bacterium]